MLPRDPSAFSILARSLVLRKTLQLLPNKSQILSTVCKALCGLGQLTSRSGHHRPRDLYIAPTPAFPLRGLCAHHFLCFKSPFPQFSPGHLPVPHRCTFEPHAFHAACLLPVGNGRPRPSRSSPGRGPPVAPASQLSVSHEKLPLLLTPCRWPEPTIIVEDFKTHLSTID